MFYDSLNSLRASHHAAVALPAETTLADVVDHALQSNPKFDFTEAEVMGKYLDLAAVHLSHKSTLLSLGIPTLPAFYAHLLARGPAPGPGGRTGLTPEDVKRVRRMGRVLEETVGYLDGYRERVQPLLSLASIINAGGGAGLKEAWEREKDAWGDGATDSVGAAEELKTSELKEGITVSDLEKWGVDRLERALGARGMKRGGTGRQKAERLMHAVGVDLNDLKAIPQKHRAKGGGDGKGTSPSSNTGEVSPSQHLFNLDYTLSKLLTHYRPSLLQTVSRLQRRRTQTVAEKVRERDEVLTGAAKEIQDGDSEEEEEIYNPKNLPLGWDGKPIPVWLYKLHGLNKYYPCEICGDVTYRGERDFQKHFGEQKHGWGMKCLGIPNSKHFHGVTVVADARSLWKKVQEREEGGGGGEEFEDGEGNVMGREGYEGLARQGLL